MTTVRENFIRWESSKCRTKTSGEMSLLDLLIADDQPINHTCGGNGTCGTCRVIIVSEGKALSERGEIELEMATDRGFMPTERLACQLSAQEVLGADVTLDIPISSL